MAQQSKLHQELFARMRQFSTYGATAAGGVHRPEATAANGQARSALLTWLGEAGFEPRLDPIGNIFGLLPLAGAAAPWLMTGSHIDSQPNGGRFDGTYGVVASTIAAQGLRDRLIQEGSRPAMNLAVVAWTNEEGARFQPSVLGSSVYAGLIDPAWALSRTDRDGISLATALEAIDQRGKDQPPPVPAAYVELHIECGSELERAGRRLAVFDRWWGCRKLEVRFEGVPAHTGPTPMHERRDALLAAAQVVVAVRRLADDYPQGELHTSIGRVEVLPNSPNVVPCEVTVYVELRSPAADVLESSFARSLAIIEAAAEIAQVRWLIARDEFRQPGRFAPALQRLAYSIAQQLGEPAMKLDTIAAHDAVPLASVCPSLVIAPPSVGGICHSPEEFTKPDDLGLGFDLLSAMLERLLREGPDLLEVPPSPA